jgi:predicted dehydrogenase
MPPLVLVIGCGSIGERHVRTFLRTGRARVIGCDVHPETREHIAREYGVDTAPDWSEAARNPDVSWNSV